MHTPESILQFHENEMNKTLEEAKAMSNKVSLAFRAESPQTLLQSQEMINSLNRALYRFEQKREIFLAVRQAFELSGVLQEEELA